MQKIKIVPIILMLLIAFFAGCTETTTTDEEIHGDELKQSLIDQYATPSSTDYSVEVLGFLEERDDIPGSTGDPLPWYGFIIYKVTDLTESTDNFVIYIRSNKVTGTSFDTEKANELASEANSTGDEYALWGEPYVPTGDLDPKRIEYRLYQVDGEPTAVEIYVVMRNEDRTAKEPNTLRVDWPMV